MRFDGSARLRPYLVAVLCVMSATAVGRTTWPALEYVSVPLFVVAVIVSAWQGGVGPGLLATALSTLALNFFFMPPSHAVGVDGEALVRLGLFLVVSLLVSSMQAARRRAEAALVREQALLEQRVRERTAALAAAQAEAEFFADLSRSINGSLDPWTVLQRAAEGARRIAAGDLATIALREPGSETSIEGFRVGARGLHRPLRIEPGKGLGGRVLLLGRPLRTADYASDPAFTKDFLSAAQEEGVQSAVAVPIMIRDAAEGVIFVARRSARPFTDGEEATLVRLADHTATAIANAALLAESATRQAHLEALLEISGEMAQVQPMEALLEHIAGACARLLEASWVFFRLLEGDELVKVGAWGVNAEPLDARVRVGESLSGMVAAAGEPMLISNPADDPRLTEAHRALNRQHGTRAALGVPVKIGERVLGVVCIGTPRASGFAKHALEIATAFAACAAIALENARLLQEGRRAYEELARLQDQLVRAQKLEALGRLAGGIANDFNNLLTVVTGRTELMLNELAGDPTLRRHLERIRGATDRAVDLTRHLLAFSRQQVLRRTVFDVTSLARAVAAASRRPLGDPIVLVFRAAERPALVNADRAAVEQALRSLVSNARDAMPDRGQLTVSTGHVMLDEAFVRAHPGARPGLHVFVDVADTGAGMDAATVARVFEPFFTTKEGKGAGLGLATAYGIVRQHEGTITLTTSPSQGTTIRVHLPAISQTHPET